MMKKKIAVLFGGQSTEHEVSRSSAASILRNLNQDKYDICPIGITKKGEWYEYHGSIDKVESGEWEHDEHYKTYNAQELLFKRKVDVVFPVLDGLYGEDGTIQGLCKLICIPCVGSGVMSSSICMDKVYTKYVLEKFGVKMADYCECNAAEYKDNKQQIINDVENRLGYAVFIKPSNSGSSVGITKAHNRTELEKGILEAFKYDRKVLIEKAVNAREIEVAVLGNDEPEAAAPGEIIPGKEFYDYEAKYSSEKSRLIIPAALKDEKLEEIKQTAIKVYKALDCAGMARVDFLIDKNTLEVYLNEVNTIPGFTKISMYPKMWNVSGKLYGELLDELIELAIERNNK